METGLAGKAALVTGALAAPFGCGEVAMRETSPINMAEIRRRLEGAE